LRQPKADNGKRITLRAFAECGNYGSGGVLRSWKRSLAQPKLRTKALDRVPRNAERQAWCVFCNSPHRRVFDLMQFQVIIQKPTSLRCGGAGAQRVAERILWAGPQPQASEAHRVLRADCKAKRAN
jgi:hypothetical protein